MDPKDPRHGTDRGHAAHMRSGVPPCPACVAAHSRMNKVRRLYPERFAKVPTVGARRRLQALQALGYGRDRLARELGYGDPGSLAYLMSPKSVTVTQATDKRIREVYDRLCMKPPPTHTGAARARTWARRHGYAPPLAWDDIDDQDEQPQGITHPRNGRRASHVESRTADLEHFVAADMSLDEALRELGITTEALWKWCDRHDRRDLYERLARGQRRRDNQHTTRGAA